MDVLETLTPQARKRVDALRELQVLLFITKIFIGLLKNFNLVVDGITQLINLFNFVCHQLSQS